VLFFSALMVGAGVSMTGIIGFVGLIVPHLIRLVFGADHRLVLPASFLLGALLLAVADLLARTIVSPAEMPIGILTAIIGCPFFRLLIQNTRITTYSMLIAKNIHFSIRQQAIVNQAEVSLQTRELLALLAPNGGGKATLLKILSGEISCNKGD